MRDCHGGAVFREFVQRSLHKAFGLVVQRAGCLVQNQHGRIFEEQPRNGNALLLTAAELDSALAANRVVAVFKSHDKIVRACELCRGDYFFVGRVASAVKDIFFDGAVEKVDVLLDDAHVFAEFG